MNAFCNRLCWALALALVYIQGASASTPSLKQRQDPFYQGPSAQLSVSETGNSDTSTQSMVWQAGYGWDTGIALQLIVPTIVGETNPTTPGNSTPRIGGGPNIRIEADGLFRAWGDTYDYLGFGIGIGFPWQSSTVNRNSVDDSWLLALAVLGRIDWDWIALVGQFADSPSYPASHLQNGNQIYLDSTNSLSISATAYTYPKKWLAPYIGYLEVFPSSVNHSIDQGQGYFALSESFTGRRRQVSFGVEFAPVHAPVLLTAEFDYIPVTPATAGTETAGIGTIRWLF